ncbi:hypothetical protein [Pseudoduganella sp. R-43]|uniref:hypothetical protein n=1 Tax=unclassified Pseudoduganella TaxID=2637179 RepID=UPI003CF65DBE
MPETDDARLYSEILQSQRIIAVVKEVLGTVPLNVRGREALAINHTGDINRFQDVWADREMFLGVSNQMRVAGIGAVNHVTRQNTNQIRASYGHTAAHHRPKVTLAALGDRYVGMCQDYAALTYALLRRYLPSDRMVSYVFETDIVHYFCTIGDHDQRQVAPQRLIIVDSWYLNADAVLWTDSHHKAARYQGNTIYCKPGKAAGYLPPLSAHTARNLIAQARAKYSQLPPTQTQLDERNRHKEGTKFMHRQDQFVAMQYGNHYTNAGNNARVTYTFTPRCSVCGTLKRGLATRSTKWHQCTTCHIYFCSRDGYARPRSAFFSETRTCTCGGTTRLFMGSWPDDEA